MEQAATATANSEDVSGFSGYLRLRQGASTRASWILDEVPGGTMITVGADSTCDWQVRAAFVPPRAFSVLVVGAMMFVRSGPDAGVLLNGRPLPDGWVPVADGCRIDIGLARIEVSTGYATPPIELTEAFRRLGPSKFEAMQYGDYSDASGEYEIAPTLLDDDAPSKPRAALWRYAVGIVVTAGAYGGWVALLDYL